MVNNEVQLDTVFGALADSTRRGMLARLSQGTATVGELGEPYDISKGAVTKHVKVLERAGLLKRDVQGRVHRCELETESLDSAQRWVAEVRTFWEARFDELAIYLEEMQAAEAEPEDSGKSGKSQKRQKRRTK